MKNKKSLIILLKGIILVNCYVGFAGNKYRDDNYVKSIKSSSLNDLNYNNSFNLKNNYWSTSRITSRSFAPDTNVDLYLQNPDGTYTYLQTLPVTRGQVTFTVNYANGEIFQMRGISVKNGLDYTEDVEVKDLTPPLAPSGVFSCADGTITGTAQLNSVVEVKVNEIVIDTTTASPLDGSFSFTVSSNIILPSNITIRAFDAAGPSSPTNLYINDFKANDDVIKADVDLSVLKNSEFVETKVLGELPNYNGINLDRNKKYIEINFENLPNYKTIVQVRSDKVKKMQLNETVKYYLYKNTIGNNWQFVIDNTSSSFSNFFSINNNTFEIKSVNNFDNGQFKLIAELLGNYTSLNSRGLNIKYEKKGLPPNNFSVKKANSSTGNILSDDVATVNTRITYISIPGQAALPVSLQNTTTIQGNYGELTISADGSYVYTPNSILDVIGKVDKFVYTIQNSGVCTSSANVYVQIGTDEMSLSWDPQDPSKQATIN